MKLDYKKTFIIGLGFFTVSLVWSIYNLTVPLYLDKLGLSGVAVGAVMTIDNIFAIILLPLFGVLSDKTSTRYGRRMPYLLVGIPLSAVAFFLIPFSIKSLTLLMISVIALNFFMSIYRAPTVALMPDFTPRPLRSKANGIINFMGGVGSVAAFLLSGFLFKYGEYVPFAIVSGMLIITIIIMYTLLRETEAIENNKGDTTQDTSLPDNVYEKGRLLSLIFMLLAVFFWFAGLNAVETFFSTYGVKVLGIDKSVASQLLLAFTGFFLLFSIPSGLIAGKLGRKKTILDGLIILMAVFVCLIFIKNISIMYVLMAIGGLAWALININSYPMVVEMTSNKGIGKYTGYYYFFSMLASIVSPILFGFLKDILGDGFLFIYSTITFVFAFFFMMLVKHGDIKLNSKSAFENLEHMET